MYTKMVVGSCTNRLSSKTFTQTSFLPTHQTIRSLPRKRSFPDELSAFQQRAGFQFKELDNCALDFHLVFDKEAKLAKILESIRVDDDLHVQLQYNGMPLPLPQWFVQGHNAGNTEKSKLFRKPLSVYTK